MRYQRTVFFSFALLAAVGLVGSCGDDGTCDQGTEGCVCYPNRTCNGSLTCGPSGRCIAPEQTGDAGIDGALDGGADLDAQVYFCSYDSDCNTNAATQGYLCVDGACAPCEASDACEASSVYGAGATCSQEGRCIAMPSCMQVGCPDGGVCDQLSGRCRDPKSCEDVGCAFGQLCQEATDSADAQCLADCEEGLVWNAVDSRCDPIPPNCRTDWANSILSDCDAQMRVCIEDEQGAQCGGCFNGYVDHDGACVSVVTCQDLDCGARNRVCLPESDHADAQCGPCLPGFGEHMGECEQQEGATCDQVSSSSILVHCASLGRTCVENAEGASCGACVEGWVENPSNGLCEPEVTCDEIDCAVRHRDCEQTYNAHCTDCSTGYVEDPATGECHCAPGTLPDENGLCETIRTCADISGACNAQGELCIEATDTHHAYCSKCPEGQTWYEHQQTCLICPPCTRPGETGQLWPVASRMGHCVCETMPGYYHSESGLGGTAACDQDGDGWLSAGARLAMEAPEGSAVRDNARCTLRTIDQIVFRNEWGEQKVIELADFDFLWDAVPLYEPVNRDRDDKIINDYDYTNPLMANYAPPLGMSGRPFSAAELNPFTKACATSPGDANARYADYNADGIPDIDDSGVTDNRQDPEARIFAMFSYYLELYRGHWEPRDDSPNGRWVIEEKTRSLYGRKSQRVPFDVGPGHEYWRTCRRHRDSAYTAGGPPYGFDFAQYGEDATCDWSGQSTDSWCGLNHHSQFKCLLTVSASDKDPAYPHHRTPNEILADYQVDFCMLGEDSFAPTDGSANPYDPDLQCHTVSLPSSGSLVWAVARYADYGHDGADNAEYVRGCINECVEADRLPEESRCQGTPQPQCRGLTDDYGKLFCFRPIDFVDVPLAGVTFSMGSPSDEPGRHDNETLHPVTFTGAHGMQGLSVMTTETTQDQFLQYMGFNPSRFDCGNTVCPVEQVTWYDAFALANILSDLEGLPRCYDYWTDHRRYAKLVCTDGTIENVYDPETDVYLGNWCRGHGGIAELDDESMTLFDAAGAVDHVWLCDGYRLPTEAEWEYLARAGGSQALWNGPLTVLDCEQDPLLTVTGWTCADGGFGPRGVALKQANPFGLFDMNGNVWEWTSDELTNFDSSPVSDPDRWNGSAWTPFVVATKGGAWNRGNQDSRAARREGYSPTSRNYAVGFRLVRSLFQYDFRSYQYIATEVPWVDAVQDCQDRGGHLVDLSDTLETRAVRKAIRWYRRTHGGSAPTFWIGLNDRDQEGTWVWSDGTPLTGTPQWQSGEPNDTVGNENCVEARVDELNGDHSWNDYGCGGLRPYVCEFDD